LMSIKTGVAKLFIFEGEINASHKKVNTVNGTRVMSESKNVGWKEAIDALVSVQFLR